MSTPTFPITVTIELSDKDGFIFRVTGSKGDIYYVGFDYEDGWYCPCPDYMFRKHECKHIRACKQELSKQHIDVSSGLFCEVSGERLGEL